VTPSVLLQDWHFIQILFDLLEEIQEIRFAPSLCEIILKKKEKIREILEGEGQVEQSLSIPSDLNLFQGFASVYAGLNTPLTIFSNSGAQLVFVLPGNEILEHDTPPLHFHFILQGTPFFVEFVCFSFKEKTKPYTSTEEKKRCRKIKGTFFLFLHIQIWLKYKTDVKAPKNKPFRGREGNLLRVITF
jgi:hypothetical protein